MSVMEPMSVVMLEKRGEHSTSYTPEPPLDQDWDKGTRLRWLAGVVRAETGIVVNVSEIGGLFGLSYLGTSHSARTYANAWQFLTAFQHGAQAARLADHPHAVKAAERWERARDAEVKHTAEWTLCYEAARDFRELAARCEP